jgi:hypothetical protein
LRPAVALKILTADSKRILPIQPIGIVDSGCDWTTFPKAWAKHLGIDTDRDCIPSPCNTAAGKSIQYVYLPGVRTLFRGKKLLLSATFAEGCPHVLLGREDFFRYFKSIAFEQDRQKLILEAVPDWAVAEAAVEINVQRYAAQVEAEAAARAAEGDAGSLLVAKAPEDEALARTHPDG